MACYANKDNFREEAAQMVTTCHPEDGLKGEVSDLQEKMREEDQ